MNLILLPLLFLPAADPKTAPKVPVGKETTYVTGPIDKDSFKSGGDSAPSPY